jgi:hypothetical protein
MRVMHFIAMLALIAGLSACHRPDPGKLTPDQQQLYKGGS